MSYEIDAHCDYYDADEAGLQIPVNGVSNTVTASML